MLSGLKQKLNLSHRTDIRHLLLYIFIIIVLAISWSSLKTIQTNYQLQKKIALLKQQNAVLDLQNQNTALSNQFYNSNEYLDLAAREDLGLAAPGETVLLISKSAALKYVDPNLATQASTPSADTRPWVIKNLEAWRDFFLGRPVFGD